VISGKSLFFITFFSFLLLAPYTPVSNALATDIETPEELLIGLIPEINVFVQVERYEPLGDYISKHSGVRIKFTILSSYGNIIDRFRAMRMDGAFFGSFTGAMAIEKLGVTPLVRPVNLDGESSFHGVIIVRKDANISTVKDMKGKRIAFVDRATTAGYIFPLAYFRKHGLKDIDDYFSELYFAGSHDAAIYDVFNGMADIGTAKSSVFQGIREKSPMVANSLKVIATSRKVPSNSLCLREGISAGLLKKIKNILLKMDQTAEGRIVLEKFGARRFVETTVESYDSVMKIASDAGISIKNYSYQNR